VDGDDRSCDVFAVDEVEGALRFERFERGGDTGDPVDGMAIVGLSRKRRVSDAQGNGGSARKGERRRKSNDAPTVPTDSTRPSPRVYSTAHLPLPPSHW
jgi:hypothetical protein